MSIAVSPTPVRQFPVIRVFVSSTFSDLVAERNALAENVWPELEKYCRQRGFTFQSIDLRWGVPSEAGLDHRTMQICFEELHRAQETSPEPNFLILLGNKYGWRPLPETISETEYTRLFEHTQSPDEQDTLADWYRRDGNARPPHHILRARTDSPDGQDCTRVPGADGRPRYTDAWLTVQERLWSIVNRAYPGSLLPQRFAKGTDDMPASVRFQGSATEQEIWHGALRVENARDHVVAWHREIDLTGGGPDPSQLKRFFDLRPDQSPDADAAAALAELKTQVEQKLAPEPILHARCSWGTDANGTFTGEVTTDHLAPMCEAILTRLRTLILRQINDYWKADLSADDATAASVQGSQQALDLELRDHQRFAQERGPVDLFVGRDEQVRSIRDYLQTTTNRPLIVHGPSGSGKTALLAYVAQQPILPGAEAGGVSPLILNRFIGTHSESSNLRGLMTSLCRELRVHFPVTEPLADTLQKLTEEFYAQLGHATAERPIYVFLDALDQLEAADQARDCFWLRSQINPQAGESTCHARIVVSCLSPSPEFPAESDACEPFRRLQTRGLLADEELGALSEAAACKLLRQWLANQQRGLTEDQWKQVDASIRESSERRQPLYLRALIEQLRGWHALKTPETLPASLAQLIQETLTRLCKPNQHGQLARIALAYLVSARYGLSEGELLEILFRDPEMQAQLDAAERAYGHRLPDGANRYPIAPWSRLRSDLRAYLSERAAPGTTVLSCYHRQVEQAVRTLFLADEATRTECRRLLADYFDTRWDQPDAHALMELPDLLLSLSEHQRLYDRLTNFAFPMRKAEVGLLETIPDDYTLIRRDGPTGLRAPLGVWQDFFREQAHILRRGVGDQTAHKILLQLAINHGDDSPLSLRAERWLAECRCNWFWMRRVPRPTHIQKSPCVAVLEGHTKGVVGALQLTDGRLLSWSHDHTLRIWDENKGACLATLEGHTHLVAGALELADGNLLSWAGYDDPSIRLWDRESGYCQAVLIGHTSRVGGALQLDDGRLLSWSDDTTLRVWDSKTGTCLLILKAHCSEVQRPLKLAGGRLLSRAASDIDMLIWDTESGDCLAVLEGHTCQIKGALRLDDGRLLSWSDDGTLRVWDYPSGICLAVLKGHSHWVQGALVLAKRRLVSWADEPSLRVWDLQAGECLAALQGHTERVKGTLAIADGRLLSWSADKTLRLWDEQSGACLAVFEGSTAEISGALILPNGQVLSWAQDGTLRIWCTQTGNCVTVMEGHSHWVHNALQLPGGRILSWAGDESLRLWDSQNGACLAVLEGHTNSNGMSALALTDGRLLSWALDKSLRLWDIGCGGASEGRREGRVWRVKGTLALGDTRMLSWTLEQTLRLWDMQTGECLAVLEGHSSWIKGALQLPGGRLVSWSLSEQTLRLWEVQIGECLAVLEGHSDTVGGAIALADGRLLSWSHDKTLRLWDGQRGTCLAVLTGHTWAVKGALQLADGRLLSWSGDSTMRLWDERSAVCLTVWEEDVWAMMRLPDGRFLTSDLAGVMRLWDQRNKTCVAVLESNRKVDSNPVIGALFLTDGQLLTWENYAFEKLTSKPTGSPDLRLWDTLSGTCLAVLTGHTDEVSGALVLTDERLLSWSLDKTFRLWNWRSGAALAVLTEEQVARMHPDWLYIRAKTENVQNTSASFFVGCSAQSVSLCHMTLHSPVAAWQAEPDVDSRCLLPDGTVVVTQANGQVCILKLHHGNRRVTLAEAEELLRSGGK